MRFLVSESAWYWKYLLWFCVELFDNNLLDSKLYLIIIPRHWFNSYLLLLMKNIFCANSSYNTRNMGCNSPYVTALAWAITIVVTSSQSLLKTNCFRRWTSFMYLSNKEKDLFSISSCISMFNDIEHEIQIKHRIRSLNTILLFILSGPQQFQNRVNCLCFAWPLAAAINDECHESKETFLKKFIFDKKTLIWNEIQSR